MKRWFLFLLLTVLFFVSSCSNDDKGPELYYMIIVDLDDIDSYNGGKVASEVIEAENAEEATHEAISEIMSHLYAEASVALIPNAITKMKPHQFYVSIYDKDGNIVTPTSSENLENWVNRIAGIKDLWGADDNYKKALEYYRDNTNVFSSTIDIFNCSIDLSETFGFYANPVEEIKKHSSQIEDKGRKLQAEKWMIIFGGIAFIILAFFLLKNLLGKKPEEPTKEETEPDMKAMHPNFTVKITSGDGGGAYSTRIAGVPYNCSDDEIGGFLGYVRSEPDNPYDKNAIAIYRNDGKILGHLPKDETREFRRWSLKEDLPCVGFIKANPEGALFGKVKIMDTDDEEAQLIVIKYVKWMISNLGVKYIPEGFNVSTDQSLKTKEQWLAVLDDYIEEKESDLYEEVNDKDE